MKTLKSDLLTFLLAAGGMAAIWLTLVLVLAP